VLFLLRLDRKQSTEVNGALWIPTIWMLYTASKPLAYWFPSSGATPESSPLDRVFIILLMCAALWVLSRKGINWSRAIRANAWLIILIAFMLVSVLWSSIPTISFKRWLREFAAVLMAFVVLSSPSPRQALECILRRTTYILIPFSLLLIKYFPVYGVSYGRWSGTRMWIGVTLQKNGLGRLCIICAFFMIWSLVRRQQGNNVPIWKYQSYLELFLLLLTFYLLGGPDRKLFYSATAVYALILGLLVYCGLLLLKRSRINLGSNAVVVIVAIIIVTGYVTLFAGGSNIRAFASSAGRAETLTGRTEVWAMLLPVAMQRPLFGGGLGGFWTPRTRDVFQISEAHSGYLEVLLDFGFIGVLLLSMFLFSSARKAQQELSHDFDWGTIWICYLIMAVVHNIAESSINSLTSHMTAVVLFFSIISINDLSSRRQ
jgi:exopolysaccharide production protein ExoQ